MNQDMFSFSEGIFHCDRENKRFDPEMCDEVCCFCIDGMNTFDIRREWDEILSENGSLELLALLSVFSDEEFSDILACYFCDITDPYYIFSHDRRYYDIASIACSYDTIIDFGSGFGLQSYLFDDVRYIGVDDFFYPPCHLAHHEFHLMPAQEFIAEHIDDFDLDNTLAVCLNVPDAQARQMIADIFPHNIIVYNGRI